ncbi:DegT/DnrJ/EryC1/StrS family aminotransferase [Deferribacter autotrophicus]|uniref:DegT/DnrJ/EryC1/StrS family aminotransferase n=1 Tax=Deferribacter autotrophicus TaxID=500465 RepID=A0A5A8F4N4_9BACT|nr:DegT/DnrJ/EryC1/StrS family aminotransferase [Deferribacter autotrophicus]KAA0258996.1 DegT/DnrJ/EryC1/StrS family aminotransferase [Deferribacter autotrophicus]
MKSKPAIEGGKPVRDSFLVFGQPDISDDELNEVIDTIRSKWIGTGPKTHKFQEEFRKYIGAKYAHATNSCTAALHLSLIAAGIKPGDEVITTPMTFCATANAIIHAGATPIFVDIDKTTLNIDVNKIEEKITKKTKAILPVHFAGRPCNMDKIQEIAKKYNLVVIEDAAHAIEAYYKNKKIGTIGDLTCFSFYVTKNMTTVEGGMVTGNNEELINKIRILSLHGMDKDAWKRYSDEGYKHYMVVEAGFKYNMTDIQASFGLHQLKKINENFEKRKKIWKMYDEAFADLPLIKLANPDDSGLHARHLYIMILDLGRLKVNRDYILEALTKENIGVGVHYISLHKHPYYKNLLNLKDDDFPNSSFISDRTISIPFGSYLSDRDVEDVINAVRKILTFYWEG